MLISYCTPITGELKSKCLQACSLDTRLRAQFGCTPLVFAAMYDKVDAIRVLCELKANLEAKDKVRGGPALYFLSRRPTHCGNRRRTALHSIKQFRWVQ